MINSRSHAKDPPGAQSKCCTADSPHFLPMSSRAPTCATCRGHRTWQSPGEIRQLRRICTACGSFPGSPVCQAPSWILEVCSAAACRAVELREEYHLLPSYVSRRGRVGGFGIFHWECLFPRDAGQSQGNPRVAYTSFWNPQDTVDP